MNVVRWKWNVPKCVTQNSSTVRTHPEEVVELLGHIEALVTSAHPSENLRDRGVSLLAVLHALVRGQMAGDEGQFGAVHLHRHQNAPLDHCITVDSIYH